MALYDNLGHAPLLVHFDIVLIVGSCVYVLIYEMCDKFVGYCADELILNSFQLKPLVFRSDCGSTLIHRSLWPKHLQFSCPDSEFQLTEASYLLERGHTMAYTLHFSCLDSEFRLTETSYLLVFWLGCVFYITFLYNYMSQV